MKFESLKGKYVLLIAPIFFGYSFEIANEFRRRGAIVDFLPDRPFQSPFMKAGTRFAPSLLNSFAEHFFWEGIEKYSRSKYDFVFVVIGEALTQNFLHSLRSRFPSASYILYMWDSFENKKSLVKNIQSYDRCITFDLNDAKNYGLNFRPLFFSDGFKLSNKSQFNYDLSFIGTAHSDRYSIISKIAEDLPKEVTFYTYLFLQAPWVFFGHKLFNKAFINTRYGDFKYVPLEANIVQLIFSESRVVLDIEHPKQIGLTMRTFETLGSGKKLITTNSKVREYDFYDSQNICIVDREGEKKVKKNFFKDPYTPIPLDLYYKYSLQGWVDDVIS